MRSNAYKFLYFKTASYSSAVLANENSRKLQNYYYEAEGWPSFKSVATHSLLINEALRLSGSPFVASTMSP